MQLIPITVIAIVIVIEKLHWIDCIQVSIQLTELNRTFQLIAGIGYWFQLMVIIEVTLSNYVHNCFSFKCLIAIVLHIHGSIAIPIAGIISNWTANWSLQVQLLIWL